MLNQINRILLLGTIIIYVVVFKFLILPLLSGVQSTHTIQQELVQLQQHRITQLSRLSFFEQLQTKWGTKLQLSKENLLPFLLTKLEEEKLNLLDFKEERRPQALEITRFKIELQGGTFNTLCLLNALEHSFPFATIHDLHMVRKTRDRVVSVHTYFYIQQ